MSDPAQGHRSMVDTNLFVYAYDAAAGPKRTAVRALLDSRGRSGELVLSTQVLGEFFVTVARSYFSGSVRYSNDWFTFGESFYYELNGTFPIGETGFSVLAHYGYSDGTAWDGIEYTDYAVGVSKGFGNFTGSLKFVASDADESSTPVFSTDDRVILSISTTLPWAK